jgi:hypothetical protein
MHRRFTSALFAVIAASCGLAFAHDAPHSMIKLDFLDSSVRAEVLVPESELAFALAADGSVNFAPYLLRHLSAETPQGKAWKVELREVRNISYLDHPYILANIELTPPGGASSHSFVLIDDAVTHEVRNHVVMVFARGVAQTELLGALQYPARRLFIDRHAAVQPVIADR